MGKHEIRLRRQRMSARGSDRFRNYNAVLKQHSDEKRIKQITRIFTFFLLIALIIVIFIAITRWEENQNVKPKSKINTTVLCVT
jgi:heme/copper-type cytochrome/quinol oxidase subunit 2